MFLQPSEVGFLKYLKEARIPLVEFELPANKILNIQSQLEMLIGKNYYLNKVSRASPAPKSILLSSGLVGQRRLQVVPARVCVAQPAVGV